MIAFTFASGLPFTVQWIAESFKDISILGKEIFIATTGFVFPSANAGSDQTSA
jgi:hypothetical protein